MSEVSTNMKSKEKINHIREELPIISQVAAYDPPIRTGQQHNRRELRMQKKTSRLLYSRRLRLAKNIVRYHDLFLKDHPQFRGPSQEDRKSILNKAMIASKLSPMSNEGWDKYILALSDEYGGWNHFINRLKRGVNEYMYFNRKIIQYVIFALACFFITFALPINGILHGYKFIVVDILIVVIYLLCFYACLEPYRGRKETFQPSKIDRSEKIKRSDILYLQKA